MKRHAVRLPSGVLLSPASLALMSGLAGVLLGSATPVAAEGRDSAWNALLNGERQYLRQCVACHGHDLKGLKTAPDLLKSPRSDDKAAFTRSLLEGKGQHAAFKNDSSVADGANNLFAFVNNMSRNSKTGK